MSHTETKTWWQETRLRAVEVLAYWTGCVNASDLMERFGITRPAAREDIQRYLTAAPGNLIYDGARRAYVPTAAFKPTLSEGTFDEYGALETAAAQRNAIPMEVVKMPGFAHLEPMVVRPLLQAIREKKGLMIVYRSLNHPEGSVRQIFPHSMVHSGFRWHVRAWCAEREEFRDFVLGRFADAPARAGTPRPEAAAPEQDAAWHERVTVQLVANRALSAGEREVIEHEFGMRAGVLRIETRAALVSYVLQAYQVPFDAAPEQPRRDRLLLANRDELGKWLFSRPDRER